MFGAGQTQGESEGHSATARAFGADVAIATGAQAMCLVVTRGSPVVAVNAVGGRLLAALSPTRSIAVLDITRLAELQRHPDVEMAGSVSVDPQRFARFQQIIEMNA